MGNNRAGRVELDKGFRAGAPSPVPSIGNNLFTFLAARLSASFGNLNCKNYGLTDPVTLTLDANGVATHAALSTAMQTSTGGPARSSLAPTTPPATPATGGRASSTSP